jgi:hypothetical protein
MCIMEPRYQSCLFNSLERKTTTHQRPADVSQTAFVGQTMCGEAVFIVKHLLETHGDCDEVRVWRTVNGSGRNQTDHCFIQIGQQNNDDDDDVIFVDPTAKQFWQETRCTTTACPFHKAVQHELSPFFVGTGADLRDTILHLRHQNQLCYGQPLADGLAQGDRWWQRLRTDVTSRFDLHTCATNAEYLETKSLGYQQMVQHVLDSLAKKSHQN